VGKKEGNEAWPEPVGRQNCTLVKKREPRVWKRGGKVGGKRSIRNPKRGLPEKGFGGNMENGTWETLKKPTGEIHGKKIEDG